MRSVWPAGDGGCVAGGDFRVVRPTSEGIHASLGPLADPLLAAARAVFAGPQSSCLLPRGPWLVVASRRPVPPVHAHSFTGGSRWPRCTYGPKWPARHLHRFPLLPDFLLASVVGGYTSPACSAHDKLVDQIIESVGPTTSKCASLGRCSRAWQPSIRTHVRREHQACVNARSEGAALLAFAERQGVRQARDALAALGDVTGATSEPGTS